MTSAQALTTTWPASQAATMLKKNLWPVSLSFPVILGPLWCLAWQGHGGRIGTLSGFVLLALITVSAITDFNLHRIYNWATYSAFLWAVALNIVATSLNHDSQPILPSFAPAGFIGPHFLGGVGISECLAGAGVCFLIVMFGYDLSGGGAGDVKLATAIAALLGLHDGVFAIAYSYVIAGLAIIVLTTCTQGPLALVKAGVRKLGSLFGPLWPFPHTADDQKILMTPVPLGPYFAIGTLLVVLELVPT